MKRALALTAVLAAAIAALAALTAGGGHGGGADPTYKIELDDAFGLTTGGDFKVAGVPAGKITAITLDRKTLHALITVSVNQAGFGQFRANVFCESAPESLIGDYYVNCNPGNAGPVLKPGSTIPVSHTFSTIPADLIQNIQQLPYRQRLAILIDQLGAAVAGNSTSLQAALARAVPALRETDNLLGLLADNSRTLQELTANANQVVTALADNKVKVQNFIQYANRAAVATAAQQRNVAATWHELPGFLAQLRPAMAKLDQATAAGLPVLANLNASSAQLDRFFTNLRPFARASLPALQALGKAAIPGRVAVIAARPTVGQLNQFALHTPELSNNLAIVAHQLDDRSYAVEKNPASPGGQGYTGLEALLQFAFNLAIATNYYGTYGHMLAVDAFVSGMCSPYATPQTIAINLKQYGSAYRQCYSWLGPNQPGVNEPDPTNPGGCVGDPGGAPPGEAGPPVTPGEKQCSSSASTVVAARQPAAAAGASGPKPSSNKASAKAAGSSLARRLRLPGAKLPAGASKLADSVSSTLGSLLSRLGGGLAGQPASSTAPLQQSASSPPPGGTQQLLNYLLSP
jgi:virulence factor Mce-like protein